MATLAKSLDVLPGHAVGYFVDGPVVDPIFSSNGPAGLLPFAQQDLDLCNLVCVQLLARLVSLPGHAIGHVIGASPPAQVGRFYAARVITRMKNLRPGNLITTRQYKRDSMRLRTPALLGVPEPAITFLISVSHPHATPSYGIRWAHMEPEAFFHRCAIQSLLTKRRAVPGPSSLALATPVAWPLLILASTGGPKGATGRTLTAGYAQVGAASLGRSDSSTVLTCSLHEGEV